MTETDYDHPRPRPLDDRLFVRLVFTAAALVLLGCPSGETGTAGPPASASPDSPHILLLSIDTLSRDATSLYAESGAATPNLARWTEGSVRFSQAHATSSWTLPSQASLMTGRYPDRHGAIHPEVGLHNDVPVLAEALRAVGYETVAFTGSGFMAPRYGFHRGFDSYDEIGVSSHDDVRAELPRRGRMPEVHGEALFDRAIAYLRQRENVERPLFLFLHTYSVHDYYDLRPWALGALEKKPTHPPEHLSQCLQGAAQCSPDVWTQLEQLYAAEVRHLDEGLGRLFEVLSEGLGFENSVLVVASDHGEGFDADRGRLHHGGRLHEDVIRIPLWIRIPGGRARVETTPVSLVDVAPTLLELAGAKVPDSTDGLSLVRMLRGEEELGPRALYAMEHAFFWQGGRRAQLPRPPRYGFKAVIKDEMWMLHGRGGEELYDVASDPEQSERLPAPTPGAEALRQAMAERSAPSLIGPSVEQDAELRRQLEALGYVD